MKLVYLLLYAIFHIFVIFSSVSAANKSTTGNGSVMLSIWQEGTIKGDGFAASVVIDTGIRFIDLLNLGDGKSIVINIESIFDVSSFLEANVISAKNNPSMNIVGAAQQAGFAQMFSSYETFNNSAINIELKNSLNKIDLFLDVIPDSGSLVSLDYGYFPNAANIHNFNKNFGKSFQDIDNAYEIVGTDATSNDGSVKGKMILFQTSENGPLNGLPLQINNFAGQFTFDYDMKSGELIFTNSDKAAD